MMRRLLPITFLLAATVAVSLAARPATLVLNSGERVSGELTYTGGNDVQLNGRAYPFSEIAIIAFQPGDPSAAELQQVSLSGAELERHMFVMSNGQVVHGKLHNITSSGERISFDPREGGAGARREVDAGQIARIYINGASARNLYANVLNPQPAPAPQPAPTVIGTTGVNPPPGSIAVNAGTAWTDTGINVKKGNRVSFNATGEIQIATGGSSPASPDGAPGGAAGAGKPVPQMGTGGLIGRVGNGAPFPIGRNTSPITMPAGGRLFLGINDDNFSDNSGAFYVVVVTR